MSTLNRIESKPTIRKANGEWECVSYYNGNLQLSVSDQSPAKAYDLWRSVMDRLSSAFDDFTRAVKK